MASVIRWCLEPRLRRSTGLGPRSYLYRGVVLVAQRTPWQVALLRAAFIRRRLWPPILLFLRFPLVLHNTGPTPLEPFLLPAEALRLTTSNSAAHFQA